MKQEIIKKSIGLEHPSVKRVIEIAEEIMDKNQVLNIETLYNVSKKELKIPRNGLLVIIQFLLNKKILIEGSKFSKKTLLTNPIRRSIHKYIKLNPGVHFSELKKKSISGEHISSGQLIWHLSMLIKFNFIKKFKVGNYSIFIPFAMNEDNGRIFFLLRDPIIYKILNLMVKNNILIKSEIYKEINEKREIVYYRINNLMDYNILNTTPDSSKNVILNPSIKKNLFKILKSTNISR